MSLPRQISTFFGVGLISLAADYGVFLLLTELLDVEPVRGALAGYMVGGLVNYLLNRAHTFTTERSHIQAGLRFASVMAVGFSLTGLFMWLFTDALGIHKLLARLMTTGIVFVWNFSAHKFWTFGERSGGEPSCGTVQRGRPISLWSNAPGLAPAFSAERIDNCHDQAASLRERIAVT